MLRVLIIEDNAVLRRGLAQIFSQADVLITQLENGKHAVDLINKEPQDLIICDLRLPGIDGLRVLSHLREIGQTTPFILVTAYYSEDLARRATALGADAIFEKPVDLNRLMEKCETYLGTLLRAARRI